MFLRPEGLPISRCYYADDSNQSTNKQTNVEVPTRAVCPTCPVAERSILVFAEWVCHVVWDGWYNRGPHLKLKWLFFFEAGEVRSWLTLTEPKDSHIVKDCVAAVLTNKG